MKTYRLLPILLLLLFLGMAFTASAQKAARITPLKATQGEGFGASTAADLNQFAVASKYTRMVYIFSQGGAQVIEMAKIAGVNPMADQAATKGFGSATVLRGNYLAVAAPMGANGTLANAGAVEVFSGVAHDWKVTQFLQPAKPEANGKFGTAIALYDQEMVIGAPGHELNGGRAFLYTLENEQWKESMLPEQFDPGASFGQAVAMTKGWMAIGAPGFALKRESMGAIFLYKKTVSQGWERVQQLTGSREQSLLGTNLTMNENTLVTSAVGKVVVFNLVNTAWQPTAEITAPAECTNFGSALSLSPDGNQILIGSSGHAFLYTQTGGNWTLTQTYEAPTPEYGKNGSIGDGYLILNAPLEGDTYVNGAVYLFPLPAVDIIE